jgi:predicted aspartyl protease
METRARLDRNALKGEIPRRLFRRVGFAVALLAAIPFAGIAATKEGQATSLSGYKAVRVSYTNLNRMIMTARINGHPATLNVDTGCRQTILDSGAAASFDVTPSQPRFPDGGLRYKSSTEINGQTYPMSYVKSFALGEVNFGSTLVALRDSSSHHIFSDGGVHIDGILGRDLLTRKKVIINCGTRLIFFKVDPSRQVQLDRFAESQNFTRVPLWQEKNGAFTVPCSINGRDGRLVVDTGAVITTLEESMIKSLGLTLEPTGVKARFTTGLVRKISLAQVNNLTIGDFKVRPMKLAVNALPNFAIRQGATRVDGMLGLELLVICHAIIDFETMSLFLK